MAPSSLRRTLQLMPPCKTLYRDAMTASIEEIPWPVLHKVTERITHEVKGVNRVLYDLTPKPTGTIEWE